LVWRYFSYVYFLGSIFSFNAQFQDQNQTFCFSLFLSFLLVLWLYIYFPTILLLHPFWEVSGLKLKLLLKHLETTRTSQALLVAELHLYHLKTVT
jgi:hypothetical protein